jgi:hypothetical protein
MDFWNWKSRYVTLATIKRMDFGLVLWWTSKTFKELVLFLNVIMKSSLKWFDLWTFICWKIGTFSQKSISSWKKKTWFILKFCKYVFNELYKNKSFSGKKSLGINTILLPNYKKHFEVKKIQRKWTSKFVNSYHFWSTIPCTYPIVLVNMDPHATFCMVK